MRLLVLALSDKSDLPENYADYSEIVGYGQLVKPTKIDNLHLYNKFFEIKTLKYSQGYFIDCFAKHPDPWGEPRNWMQAFSAISVAVKRNIKFELWFPNEIIAVHYLLNHSSPSSNYKLISAKLVKKLDSYDKYLAEWEINHNSTIEDTLVYYKENRNQILQKYYQSLGKYFNDKIDIHTALEMIHTLK